MGSTVLKASVGGGTVASLAGKGGTVANVDASVQAALPQTGHVEGASACVALTQVCPCEQLSDVMGVFPKGMDTSSGVRGFACQGRVCAHFQRNAINPFTLTVSILLRAAGIGARRA